MSRLPIVLVGLPGSGKTKVGTALAARLGVEHLDTDALIEQQQGRTIADIFTSDGEERFRILEAHAVADALSRKAVISLGGGAAATPAVREVLRGHQVVYIDAPHEELLRRTSGKSHRPLLKEDPDGTLRRLRIQREPHYRSVATITVTSSAAPVSTVVDAIEVALQEAEKENK